MKHCVALLLLGLCAACACPAACAETVGLVELIEDGYLMSLEPGPEAPEAPLSVVCRDSEDALRFEAQIPGTAGSGGRALTEALYPLPDGRFAVFAAKGYAYTDERLMCFLSPAGEAQPGFALPKDTISAMPCAQGVFVLILPGRDFFAPRKIAFLDWQGRTLFYGDLADCLDGRKVVAACAEGTRAFAALFAGEGIALVCLEASEIAWSRLLTGEELSTLSEPALLPDGRGGLYLAARDSERPDRAWLLRLDAKGQTAYRRAVTCGAGDIGQLLWTWREGLPTLCATLGTPCAQPGPPSGADRVLALSFDGEGRAAAVDVRDRGAQASIGRDRIALRGGAPCIVWIQTAWQADERICVARIAPLAELPRAQGAGIRVTRPAI